MKTAAKKEQVLKNLRKFWEQKKEEEGLTQNQAAKELGWTQSAFSHYLVDISPLNRAAITKLANFLDVPPEAIDPDYLVDAPIYGQAKNNCSLAGKPPATPSIDFVRSQALSPTLIEVDVENDYAPLGTKIAVVPTESARKTGKPQIVRLNSVDRVFCVYRKTKKQKFTIKEFTRAQWRLLNIDNFEEHYTAIWVAVF